MDRWVWCDGPMYPVAPRRDPREDDPDYYRDSFGQWVKRIEWTLENRPSADDFPMYCRFVRETTELQRRELTEQYLASQGRIPSPHYRDVWIKPEDLEKHTAEFQAWMDERRRTAEEERLRRRGLARMEYAFERLFRECC